MRDALAAGRGRPERLRGVNEEKLAEALEVLRHGGLVAFPTDTLYGLGADALNEAAVERVFEAKGRPHGMALPLLLGDVGQVELVAQGLSPLAWRLAERFWPGGLTLVVPMGPRVPALVGARGWKVGVRVPDHPAPRGLARGLGRPITGTSANRTGGAEPATAAEVRRQLGDKVDLVLEGGPAPSGRSSTVLDITGQRPRLLRLGTVSLEALEEACGGPITAGEEP